MITRRHLRTAAVALAAVVAAGIAGAAPGECGPPGSPRVFDGRTYYATDYCHYPAVWQDGCGNWVTWASEKPASRPKVHRRSARAATAARGEAPIEK